MRTLMTVAAVLTAGALAAGAEPAEAKKKAPDPVPPQVAVDAKEVAAVAAGMKERIKGSPETLKKESEKLLREVQTELEYGRAIAVLEAHVELVQKFHLECQLRVQDLAAERKSIGKTLDAELARIKEQYRSTPEIAEQLQVDLIVTCRETLRALKGEEDACARQSEETFRQLLALKMEKAKLEERKRARVKGPVRPGEPPVIPSLPAIAVKPVPKASGETLKDALDSIKNLTK